MCVTKPPPMEWKWVMKMSIHAPSTLAPRIFCTGSESSKTTNPKLGSFPPTPLVLIRSSTTFPYAARIKIYYFIELYVFTTCMTFCRTWSKCCFSRKHTHEELLELALIDVMWEVADKKLVAVWIAGISPAVHVTRFRISPATCMSEQQVEKHQISSHESSAAQ